MSVAVGVICSGLVLVEKKNQQEINTPQYKPIYTPTTRNNKTQQAACTSIYRKALYLLYFFAMVRAGTRQNTTILKNTIDNLKKRIDFPPCGSCINGSDTKEESENGYREYGLKDVDRLLEIRLLRKLSIPIEDMRQMFDGKKSLRDCLEYQLEELEREKKNLTQIQNFCQEMLDLGTSLEHLDAEACLERMEQLEKEGTSFMDIKRTDIHKKKILGAVLGGGIMIVIMIFTIAILLWANSEDPIPIGWLLFMSAIPVAIGIGVVVALVKRVKEIEGGEEDEASKY